MAAKVNSCLYECIVFHRRIEPKRHEFRYKVFYALIDLDELELIGERLKLLTVNRPGLYGFYEKDHISRGSSSIRENISRYLETQGIKTPLGRIRLLTLPRILGYVFNPISIYFCDDLNGNPLTSVAEVGNTFGEWKPYLVPLTDGGTFHNRVVKYFYVSPFSDLDLEFDFRFRLPGERLQIEIDDYRGETRELMSTLSGKILPLTDGNLLLFSFKYPFLTLQVIFGIHWHALRLWIMGLRAHRKEANPELQRNVHRPHKSLANSSNSCAHFNQHNP